MFARSAALRPRYRTSRIASNRPAASWTLWSSRRPRQQQVLSFARRRLDADLCRRLGQRHHGTIGMKEGEAIESKLVTRVESQPHKRRSKSETLKFARSLLDYDEVMDEQRKRVYRYRQNLLDGHSSRNMLLELIRSQIDQHVETIPGSALWRRNFRIIRRSKTQVQTGTKRFPKHGHRHGHQLRDANKQSGQAEVEVCGNRSRKLFLDMEDEWNWNWRSKELDEQTTRRPTIKSISSRKWIART